MSRPTSAGRRRPPRTAAALLSAAITVPAILAATSVSVSATEPGGRFVVRTTTGSLAAVEHQVRSLHGTIGREMPALDSAGVTLSGRALAALRRNPRVVSVTADSPLKLTGTTYDPSTDPYSLATAEKNGGTRQVWSAGSGAGIDVALVDSGVAPVAGLSEPGKVLNGPDLTPESQSNSTRYLDTFGHGTHKAGIIAGHDTGAPIATGNTTDFLGAAPSARVVSVKVADARGNTDVSQVIAGIDWVVQHAHDPGMNIRVLNLSFGTDASQPAGLDPLMFAAEVAWRKGIVVVVSVGNDGRSLGRL